MRVNHRSCHIFVTQKLLDRADIVAIFEQVRGKRMPKRVRSCRFVQARFSHGFFDCFLQHRFVQVMPALLAGNSIGVMAGCGKHPLPSPLFSRVGVFALKGIWQSDSAQAVFEIAPVLLLYYFEMLREWFFLLLREASCADLCRLCRRAQLSDWS